MAGKKNFGVVSVQKKRPAETEIEDLEAEASSSHKKKHKSKWYNWSVLKDPSFS